MLNTRCILVYLKYCTLNLMHLMVYRKVLFGVDIHRYIQCLASGGARPPTCVVSVAFSSVRSVRPCDRASRRSCSASASSTSCLPRVTAASLTLPRAALAKPCKGHLLPHSLRP